MRHRNRVILGFSIFFLAYLFFLVLWIQVKPYYGHMLTQVGTRLAAWTTGLRVEEIEHGKEVATITFARTVMTRHGIDDLLLDLKIEVSKYSFNVPLTFALVAGLFPIFKWRKRSLIEACFMLLFIHLLYIYFFCTLQLFYNLTQVGIKTPSKALQFFLQFMWAFTDNMIIRFEPFLVATYLWLRNTERTQSLSSKKSQ